MKIGDICHEQRYLLNCYAENDNKEILVTRGEYRFLLMEYTRLGLEFAEMKKTVEGYKRELYEAFSTWAEYEPMTHKQSDRFEQLKEEFNPKVKEGSLEE